MYLVNNSFSRTLKLPNTKHDSIDSVDVSHNNFSGQLPKNISKIFSNSLSRLSMSDNCFEGNLPLSMGEMKALTRMDLSNNQFSRELPSDFLIGCFSLKFLNLSNNNFHGQIFPQYMNLPYLRYIYLNNNSFSGKIGKGLLNSTSLEALDISNNKISDKVPNWIGQSDIHNGHRSTKDLALEQESMPHFSYYYNSTLSLSSFVDDFPYLYHRFEVNFLTKNRYDSYKGDILNFMTGMDLSNNDLIGDIPSEIGDLQEIKALNLSNNFLSKSIPKSFSNLKGIESLDLSHNKLSGQIPQQLTELNYLEVFNVSYNSLSGLTPNEGQFATFGESSYVGNSGLCITLVNKSCTSAPTPPLLPANGEEGEESAIDMVAFYWSFFGSYVTIILGLLVILWINSRWRMLWFYYIGECIDLCFYWLSKYVSCQATNNRAT
ncbi:receptor-like protein 1 [Pistacia vera]|uniref:receptor-like protein 1 n=1 Tax=Pistacia vera TaxID=55513 RepID=UPI0012633C0A|nr:receptor-like protein 1 [Pistacia vera]